MWLFEGKKFEPTDIDPKSTYGFIYEITNLVNQKKYIGKKFFWSAKTRPPLKGRKNKRRSKVPSDWQDYFGSNVKLLKDVEELGPEKFERRIIRICSTKAECAYYELLEQIERNVLLDENYYNDWIMVKVRKAHLKHLRK